MRTRQGVASSVVEQQEKCSDVLAEVANVLGSLGYSSEFNRRMTGMSNIVHTFDLVASGSEDLVVIQVLSESDYENASGRLIELQAKAWDCSPDLTIALLPKGSEIEHLRKFASSYNFALVEGDDPTEISKKVSDVITSLEGEEVEYPPKAGI